MIKNIYAGVPKEELVTDVLNEVLLPRLKPGWSVLDLGISAGHAISPLAFSGLSIVGVDTNRGVLKFCQQEFSAAGIGELLTTVNMDAMQFLDTNTTLFDVVSMTDFLMFFTKTKAVELIRSAYKAIKPDGLFWIITKSTNDPLYGQISWMSPVDTDTYFITSGCHGVSTICFFAPGEIDNILLELGASVLFSNESINRVDAVVNTILARKG